MTYYFDAEHIEDVIIIAYSYKWIVRKNHNDHIITVPTNFCTIDDNTLQYSRRYDEIILRKMNDRYHIEKGKLCLDSTINKLIDSIVYSDSSFIIKKLKYQNN